MLVLVLGKVAAALFARTTAADLARLDVVTTLDLGEIFERETI